MKKYLFAALALTALVACSKDPVDEVLTSSQKSVFISIANMASDTRATTGSETTGVTAGTKASTKIDDRFYIVFADASGMIIQVAGGDANNLSSATLTSTTGDHGFAFHNIPAQVTQVAAIGNAESAPIVGQNLTVWNTLWQNEDVDAEYANLLAYSGGVALTTGGEVYTDEHTSETYPLYTASVTVAPYLARIEITRISCTDFGVANSGYDYIGVKSMTLAGEKINDDPLTYKGSAPYTFTFGSFTNDTDLTSPSVENTNFVLFADADLDDHTGDEVMTPTVATQVWSWNIVPQATSFLTTELFVSGWNYITSVPNRQVIINSYKKVDGGSTITEFEGGKIYKFAIDFKYNNMEAVTDYLCADVTVSIQNWEVVETDVDFKTDPNN